LQQIQNEIAYYEALELLPWKVRGGETRALVSLGLFFHKRKDMLSAEYYFSKALEYKAWNCYLVYGDFLYCKGDAKNKEDAFGFYLMAFDRGENNAEVRIAHYMLKERPKDLQENVEFRKKLITKLYESAIDPKKECYHEALRLLRKLNASEEAEKAIQQRNGQFKERCKALWKKFLLCKEHFAETENFYPWYPGTWNNRKDKNIKFILLIVGGMILEKISEVIGAIAYAFAIIALILFILDKVRIWIQVLGMMSPSFSCGMDYNINKRNTFYNKYLGQVMFYKPRKPTRKSYTTYEGKWELEKHGVFDPEYSWEYKTKASHFDSDGYVYALERYKGEYTAQMERYAKVRKDNMAEYCRTKPDTETAQLFKSILHDIFGVYVSEEGVVKRISTAEYVAQDIQQCLHCKGELEQKSAEMEKWSEISKSIVIPK